MNIARTFLLLVVCLSLLTLSTTASAVATLEKGVTLGGWLNTVEDYHIQTTRYSLSDFEDIASLGADHVRIPVTFNTFGAMDTDGSISTIQLNCLDKAVNWASQTGLKVIIVCTGEEILDGTYETVTERLAEQWGNVAQHFEPRAEDLVLYELLAAPGDLISAENWNTSVKTMISAIREVDTKHSIVVGPIDGYLVDNLSSLEIFEDDNVLYAFEMHDPALFTHQGGSYSDTTFNTFVVPFPYDAASMPEMNALDVGTAAESAYNNYETEGTPEWVKSRIDVAAQFAADNGVSVYCSSIGATAGTSYSYTYEVGFYVEAMYRSAWYETVRTHMADQSIGWTLASYRGNYSIFDNYDTDPNTWMKFSNFEYDVNDTIATALGFVAPPEAEYVAEPLIEGITLFEDEFNPVSRVGFWLGDGEPNFFIREFVPPLSGEQCMAIWYPGQYNAVDMFFPLYEDMSLMAEDGYVLDFFINCYDETGHIQARFEDTNEDLEDRPWRMNYHVDNTVVPFNGEWQRVTIPLVDMNDQGAWDPDDRTWYGGGQGLPDWSRVQRLQFVSETAAQPETEIYIDRVRIVDPATLVEEGVLEQPESFELLDNYPNPFNPGTTIQYKLAHSGDVDLTIFNVRGEQVKTLVSGTKQAGHYTVQWDGTNSSGVQVPSGVYFYRLNGEEINLTKQMLLIR